MENNGKNGGVYRRLMSARRKMAWISLAVTCVAAGFILYQVHVHPDNANDLLNDSIWFLSVLASGYLGYMGSKGFENCKNIKAKNEQEDYSQDYEKP